MWELLRRIFYNFYSQKQLNIELMNAARFGNLNRVNALIAAGVYVNARDRNGDSSLMLATRNGHAAIVDVLIAARADVNAKNYSGDTSLLCATRNGHAAIVAALIAAGANVNAVNSDKENAFILAGEAHNLEVMLELIKTGAAKPLIMAAKIGHIRLLETLIVLGVNVNTRGNYDGTALTEAAYNGHTEIVTMLIVAGGDVTERNMCGYNALMCAAECGYIDVIDAILTHCTPQERQVLFNQVDNVFGTNAITLAFEDGHHDAVAVLQEYGAVLPAHLAAHNMAAAGLNDGQSTHEVSVHESVSCSILGLASQYLPELSDEEREALIVKCGDDKKKAQAILEKALQQESVQTYIEERLGFALEFSRNLKESDCQFDEYNGLKVQAAKRGIQRVLDNEHLLYFEDGRSKVSMALAMGLVWDGLWDVENKNIEHLKRHEKNEIWVQAFYEMQRGYNLDEDGKETAPDEADSYICVPGHFNKLVSALAGDRHPRVEIIIVTKVIARLRTQALIGEYYLKKVPFDEMMKYFGEIETTGRLPQKLWEDYLGDEITQIVKTEYQSFVEAEMITDAIVQKAINEAKELPLSGEVIKKICKPLSLDVEIAESERRQILSRYGVDEINQSEGKSEQQLQMICLGLESSEKAVLNRAMLNTFRLLNPPRKRKREKAEDEGPSTKRARVEAKAHCGKKRERDEGSSQDKGKRRRLG